MWVRGSNLTGGHNRLSCPRLADTALKPYLHVQRKAAEVWAHWSRSFYCRGRGTWIIGHLILIRIHESDTANAPPIINGVPSLQRRPWSHPSQMHVSCPSSGCYPQCGTLQTLIQPLLFVRRLAVALLDRRPFLVTSFVRCEIVSLEAGKQITSFSFWNYGYFFLASWLTRNSLLTWGLGWEECGGTLLTWTLWKATTNWWLIILGLPAPSKIFKLIHAHGCGVGVPP